MGESSKRKRKRNKKKTTKAWEKVMGSFTDDLWIEIFLRLPIKSLLRNKSVSKSWFSIISSHRFAKSHLDTATKDDQVLIVHHDLRYFDEEEDGSFSNKNVWRKIGSKPYDDAYSNIDIDFDLCYHGFLFGIKRKGSMMAFDLNKEFFIWDINLPVASFDDGERYFQNRVADYKDTIAITITHMEEGRIQLWTLDDEACLRGGGVIASWTKVFTVDVGVPLNFVGGFFNNVQFALEDESPADGFLYDMNKKVIKYFPEHPYFETCQISKYTKSLFSLEGFKRIKWAASSVWDVEMDE